ncbi:MAG: hypothetical protein PHR19_09260 [Bacteroidales bacterium]|nr:hypothetical protein [Bacteroidales bacterium]
MVSNLRSSNAISHQGDKGEVNEQHFIEFLSHYLPNRYTVEKAIVLDSEGVVSDSIDIVVFDRQYTPTLLDNDKHRYVPAEAVYAVFECKPTINKEYLEYTADKIESVRKLKRTSIEIIHAGGTHGAKKPFDIIGGILAIDIKWKDGFGTHFHAIHANLTGSRRVDCGFAASQGCFDIFSSEEYAFGGKENALGFFVFRLLSKLQSLGTVPAVDWLAYAESLKK